ncbi:Uncharacterised protein [Klebsiella pneumoniae]|nr:Uncharacterised protein [Klebsiella pneumoniae]
MKKEIKESIYDKLIKKDLHIENTNLLVMSSYLDPFCFSELYILKRLRRVDSFENKKIKTIPYELFKNAVSEWFLIYTKEGDHYTCDSMVSGGGEIWASVSTIYSIKSILFNGESQNYFNGFTENYMIKFAPIIQTNLKNGNLKPYSGADLDEVLDIYTPQDELSNKLILKFSSINLFIQESESINKKSYNEYIKNIGYINDFLKVNYFNKIEGDEILGGLVNDLGFE